MITELNKKELYDLLYKYLNLLVNTEFFSGNKKYRDGIKKIIAESFSILCWLGKQSENKEQEITDLFKVFSENFEHDQKIEWDIDYSNKKYSELKDEINYVKVCVNNLFKIDLDTVDLEELKKKESVAAHNYSSQTYTTAEAVNKNFFDVISEENPTDHNFLNNLVLKNSAWSRLNQDIEKGIIYIYKNKPKKNVFFKHLIFAVFAFAVVCSMISVFWDIGKSVKFFPFAVFSVCYLSFIIYKIHNSLKNDNYKYSFQKNTLIHMCIFCFLFFFCVRGLLENSASNYFLYGSLALSALGTTMYLVGFLWFQPTKDQEIIDKTLEKHMSVLSKDIPINN